MKYSRKLICLYTASIALLLFSLLLFIFIFCFAPRNTALYLICFSLFSLCAIISYYTNKRMLCEEGYTWVQAYSFYKKSQKRGVHSEPQKLTPKDMETLRQLAKNCEFCEGFKTNNIRTLFQIGYDVSKIL